jgi:hypothetical protein
MLAVQIVGVVLMVLGIFLLIRAVGAESDVTVPGVTIKAPSSVLVLIIGVIVFLFPFTPWWPEDGLGQTGETTDSPPPVTPPPVTPPPVTPPPVTPPPVTPPPVTLPPVTPPPVTLPPVTASFAGIWKNTDPNTRGLVEIDIGQTPTGLTVRPWGSCTPTPCDWGTQFVSVPSDATNFDIQWDESFAVRSQHYELGSDGRLAVRTMTHFTDASGRADYTSDETFAKSS